MARVLREKGFVARIYVIGQTDEAWDHSSTEATANRDTQKYNKMTMARLHGQEHCISNIRRYAALVIVFVAPQRGCAVIMADWHSAQHFWCTMSYSAAVE